MGWISVEDRLPNVSCRVLLVCAGVVNGGWYELHDNAWDGATVFGDVISDVTPTHWQPLPEPPTVSHD